MKTLKTDTQVLRKAIDTFGVNTQYTICMEECAELIQACSKAIRCSSRQDTIEHLLEEIADVQVMLNQLILIADGYGFSADEFEEIYKEKIYNLRDMLEGKRGT